MASIKDLILCSWNREDIHVNHWGKEYETGYYCSPRGYRDVVEVDNEGNKTYSLWGTPLCYKTKDNDFYFYATGLGSAYYDCMSQTSRERINNLINYGSVIQRRGENYWAMGAKEVKLEMGNWYKVDIGKAEKVESPIK